jgi:hypothetical protein
MLLGSTVIHEYFHYYDYKSVKSIGDEQLCLDLPRSFNALTNMTTPAGHYSFTFNESDRAELDLILSFDESEIIVKNYSKKQKNKKTSKIRYLISDELYIEIIEALHSRMISNILNNLVNKGLVETAFDEEKNDFVFWINDTIK